MAICLERGADLSAYGLADATAIPKPHASFKIQAAYTFLVPVYPGCPGKEAIKRGCSSSSSSNSSLVFTQLANATGVISVCGSR